jgi:hypothetical protein
MKDIKDFLINEQQINEAKECGVCNLNADDMIEASYKTQNFMVSRHAICGGQNYWPTTGLYFAKNVDTDEINIVGLSKTDKITGIYDLEPVSYGHMINNFCCPACGKKIK